VGGEVYDLNMRGSNAFLIAGAALLVAGLAGPSLAAENADVVPPGSEAEAVGGEVPAEPALPAEPASPAPLPGGDDRLPPEVPETDEIDGKNGYGERRGAVAGDDRSEGGASKQPLAGRSVTIEDFEFKPKTITVDPGDEVTWTNRDTAQHNAVGQGAADFETPLLAKGETATAPFNDTGTFDYICTVHPEMKGKVVVRSGGSGGSGSSGGGTGGGGTGGTSGSTDSTAPATSGTSSTGSFPSGSSSSGGGSLPNTGQAELPLLLLGTALIVIGLLAGAFREYWIWR